MALTFPVLVRHVDGHYEAEVPALPGWSAAGPAVQPLLGRARAALERALDAMVNFTPTGVPVAGAYVHHLVIEEPPSWFAKPPSE